MNAKHYVSLEVAKILEEKGYNEETEYAIDKNSEIYQERRTNQYLSWAWQCPSLLEAMDWLEKRGIHIEIRMMHCKVKGDPYKIADDDEYQWKWYFAICKDDDVKHPIVEEGEDGYVVMYTDRNECMNAAIKKGVEFLLHGSTIHKQTN